MYRDSAATVPNLTPGLLKLLESRLGHSPAQDEFFAYIMGVVAHRGFTRRFRAELRTPGIRIPLTADSALFVRAVALGRDVLACHTLRPATALEDAAVHVTSEISTRSEDMPDAISYDSTRAEVRLGTGSIGPISSDAWSYDVNGKPVVRKWFGYRRKNPTGRRTSPLDDINITQWSQELTAELLTLICCLEQLVELEPEQDRLLAEIMDGEQITVDDLETARVLPVPDDARKPVLSVTVGAQE
jgi:hypothetical protein